MGAVQLLGNSGVNYLCWRKIKSIGRTYFSGSATEILVRCFGNFKLYRFALIFKNFHVAPPSRSGGKGVSSNQARREFHGS